MKQFFSLVFLFVLVQSNTLVAAGEIQVTDLQKIDTVQKMYQTYKKDFPDITDISADKARAMNAREQIVFIDTRQEAEQVVSMIPNAVTEKVFLADPSIIRGKTAVAYCTIGFRSGVFAKKMAGRKIRISNLSGGILAWVLSGGKVYDAGRETKRIHVYGKDWDYAPEGYETVMFRFWERLVN
jgi:rhodanese-related sulfurtransferase